MRMRCDLSSAPAGRGGTTSWAAAHPVDELVHVDAVRYGPCRHLFAINRVGQFMQGLLGHLRQSCRAQSVNYMLPGELHRNHLLDEIAVSLQPSSPVRVGAAAWRQLASYRLEPVLVRGRRVSWPSR